MKRSAVSWAGESSNLVPGIGSASRIGIETTDTRGAGPPDWSWIQYRRRNGEYGLQSATQRRLEYQEPPPTNRQIAKLRKLALTAFGELGYG